MAFTVTPNQPAAILVAAIVGAQPGLIIVHGSETVTIIPNTGQLINGVTYGPPPLAGTSANSGLFTGGTSEAVLWWDTGVILTTGSAVGAMGPNQQGNFGINIQTNTSIGGPGSGGGSPDKSGIAGDADIQAIVDTYGTGNHVVRDACALEFDFIPLGNQVYFEYAFGSEEYPEFVGSVYNDLFLCLLNGVNIALIPGTATYVSINTVNAGSNFSYFTSNPNGFSAPYNIQYDGLVGARHGLKLYALATVTPRVLNHLKIVVADVGDAIFDSGLMIGGRTLISLQDGNPVTTTLHGFTDLLFPPDISVTSCQSSLTNSVTDSPTTSCRIGE